MTAITAAHDKGCVGHHCIECSACLCYDPTDPEFLEDGETPLDAAVCAECKEERK